MKFSLKFFILGIVVALISLELSSTTVVPMPKQRWTGPRFNYPADKKDLFFMPMHLIQKHASSEEFRKFMVKRQNGKEFTFVDVAPAAALTLFSDQLKQGDTVDIVCAQTNPQMLGYRALPEGFIGGWEGGKIHENCDANIKMTVEERAGHLLHEVSHMYGWRHMGNDLCCGNVYSFPYQIGYGFTEYLRKLR